MKYIYILIHWISLLIWIQYVEDSQTIEKNEIFMSIWEHIFEKYILRAFSGILDDKSELFLLENVSGRPLTVTKTFAAHWGKSGDQFTYVG